jgi:polysaccharide deacetylase family protein (PEP-CTERM system associated)
MKILTFDIEDWYNHDDYSRDFKWDKYEVRIYRNIDKILSTLDKSNQKATFFCLGWIAEKHPKIIQKITKEGHHIGCHSYQHELATRFTKEEFKKDTYKAKCLIEDLIGKEVDAYRVPSFSITKNNLWCFEILAELGFKYDSSIFPYQHEFGGFPQLNIIEPFRIEVGNGMYLKEYPINIGKFIGRKIVFSGGGYFRIIPYQLIKNLMSKNFYIMSYFHPSDFDPEQPNLPHLPLLRQFKNKVALKGTYEKFENLLQDFAFASLEQVDSLIDWNLQKIINIETLGI